MTSPDTLSLHQLRRYHFGELADEERARIEAELARQPEAKARLEKMRAEERSFLARTSLEAESVSIIDKLDRPREGSWLGRLLLGRPLQTAIACVVLVALVPLANLLFTGSVQPHHNRTKGSVQLEMFVKDQAGIRPGNDGLKLHAGDQLQFKYRAVGHRYLFVVSVDGRGVISPLYPDSETASIEVRPDGTHLLEGSVILDDAVGPERIFAVFSGEPVSYRAIADALGREPDLSRLPRLDLQGEDVDHTTILIIKE